jgi:hypothetical protein
MRGNNPFKQTNSRFSKDIFFNEDEIQEKTNEKKTDKRKNEEQEKNVNSFLLDNIKTSTSTGRDKNEYNKERRNTSRDNSSRFLPKPKPIEEKKQVFEINNNDFPELLNDKRNITDSKETTLFKKKFLDAINTIYTSNDEDKGKIKPGWIVLCKNQDNNQIKIIEGELTIYQQQQKELKILEEDPNFIMEKIHNTLLQKWEKNMVSYDAINGDGSYEDLYYLPPVYDDFYNYGEFENDEENEEENYDMDDYMDRGWTSDYE